MNSCISDRNAEIANLNLHLAEIQNTDSGLQNNIRKMKADIMESERNVVNKQDELKKLQQDTDDISKVITVLNNTLADTRKKYAESKQQADNIQQLSNELNEKIHNLNVEKAKLEQELEDHQKERSILEKFFDSEDCRKKREKIKSYERVLQLYSSGIRDIFGTDVPVGHLYRMETKFTFLLVKTDVLVVVIQIITHGCIQMDDHLVRLVVVLLLRRRALM